MAESIKNVSAELLTFEGFTLAQNETKTIVWDKTFFTEKNFSLIISGLEQQKLKYFDENGIEVTGIKQTDYKSIEPNHELSVNSTTVQVLESIVVLNEKFNNLYYPLDHQYV